MSGREREKRNKREKGVERSSGNTPLNNEIGIKIHIIKPKTATTGKVKERF